MTTHQSTPVLYEQYKNTLREIADIGCAAAILQWDQETYLPPGSAEARNRQISTLVELAHHQFTDPSLGNLLKELSSRADLAADEKINVQLSLEDYEKRAKLPPSFVRRMSEASGRAFHQWVQARKSRNFSLFVTNLEEVVSLKHEHAELLGYGDNPLDALLNEYDKGSTVQQLDTVFAKLKEALSPLFEKISTKPLPANGFLHRHYPKDAQWNYGLGLLKAMGFDFDHGRQDVSAHPFTVGFGNTDVRITTRIDENDFGNMTWSCLHEGGHALYEQGLPEAQYGLPLGEPASFSVHESQSRIWENNVGRSLDYWRFRYDELQKTFPAQLNDISLDEFYRGINQVKPSLIRTEADELTYHFHIIIRYEIERMLINKDIKPADVPAAWNGKYRDYLGITPDSDANGCLQDVHWSHGDIGYFPSYSTGTMMAAQLFAAFVKQHPGFAQELQQGHTGNLLNWLRKAIHTFGRRYTTGELCIQVTGEAPDPQALITYLTYKYEYIYNLQA